MAHLVLEKLYSLVLVPLKQTVRSIFIKPTFVPEHQTNILATFLKLAGSALVQMFIGDGARLVRDAFALGLSFFSFENVDFSKMSFVRLTTTRKHR